ncbi:hypothetical protein AK812_SmicGene28942 [Symbiodinium microadriaticum]|uniref:Uncharacterized protein n=1 Tax=Symbiodinium microadriaticum TaxID=2951 RepID=A0A1Q9D323_SYMMI|nr:hypothetical protein AK812_SmicGene28942 [Symbiodinium microadriaticum]
MIAGPAVGRMCWQWCPSRMVMAMLVTVLKKTRMARLIVSTAISTEELCRPCVDCGLYTGCYCDGNDWGDCFAADRLPRERWANNQRTPLCTACDRRFGMCHFCRGQLWACPPAHRDPARYAPDARAVPSRNYDQPIFYLAEEGAQPFQGRTTAAPRYVDLTAEDDPRGYDDMLFWEATERAGGLAAPKFGPSRHPKAKPPPTPAQIAAYNSNNVVARRAGYSAGSGRPKAKPAPDAAFRAAERDLVRLLGAAPLDDDPIEEASPPGRDPIEADLVQFVLPQVDDQREAIFFTLLQANQLPGEAKLRRAISSIYSSSLNSGDGANNLLTKALGADANLSAESLLMLPISKVLLIDKLAQINITVKNELSFGMELEELDLQLQSLGERLKLGILPGRGPVGGTELQEEFAVALKMFLGSATAFEYMGTSPARWGLPLLMAATILMPHAGNWFVSSNSGIGAGVVVVTSVSVTANGRPVVDLPPTFQFSLIGSIKDMWQGRSASAVQRLVCWFTPPSRLSVAKRQGLLNFLDAFGKWSLVDTFFMVLCMVAFNFDLRDNDKRRLCYVLCSSPLDVHGPTISIGVSLLLVLCGTFLETFNFNFLGMAGYALGEEANSSMARHRPFSVFSLGAGILILAGVYFLFTTIVVVAYHVQPAQTSLRADGTAWSGLDVFCVTILAGILELREFAHFIVGDKCAERSAQFQLGTTRLQVDWLIATLSKRGIKDAINQAVAKTTLADKLPGGVTCFDVESTLRVGFLVLALAAVVISTITGHIMMAKCSKALCAPPADADVREDAAHKNELALQTIFEVGREAFEVAAELSQLLLLKGAKAKG